MAGIDPTLLLAALMAASTPLLLAALGELVVERSGVLNLGVEGMMITGAIAGFAASVETGAPALGFLAAALAGAALALLFGLLTQMLLANQVATGLALTLFGLGLSAMLGQPYVGVRAPGVADLDLGPLSDIPFLGPVLFQHDPIVYLGLALTAGVWWFLTRTRGGLILRAVGENHDAAHALGYRVVAIRLAAIAFGGACAGLGGAYLSLVRVPQWTQGMTAGTGWIALAIVVFASWRAPRVLIGAYLFGGVTVLQLNLQAAGIQIPVWGVAMALVAVVAAYAAFEMQRPIRRAIAATIAVAAAALALVDVPALRASLPVEVLSMSPYLATIAVLVAMSAGRSRAALGAPASLGRTFHAGV